MLVHIVPEVLDQGHFLLQLGRIAVNGEDLFIVVLVDVLALDRIFVQHNARVVVEQYTN